jgi:hypothetical protein
LSGVKTADRCTVEALNDAEQAAVGLPCPIGTAPHPLIGTPSCSNVTTPDGTPADDTDAKRDSGWFATELVGALSSVALDVRTTPVGAELTGPPVPPAFVADSMTTILEPMSFAVSL